MDIPDESAMGRLYGFVVMATTASVLLIIAVALTPLFLMWGLLEWLLEDLT